ncbi:MAG: hypothetical protein Q7S39_03055, partial [Ignavibacteria bacterium]|nr:hypothetical protein [Ignavibacteria bacterium]
MRSLMTIVCMILFISGYIFPQFDVLEKVKKKTEEKVEKETDEAIDDALEGEKETEEDAVKEEESTDESDPSSTENVSSKKELKSYSKFDFVPGTNLIFYDDFSMDAVGDFPQKWNTNGMGEIVTLNTYPGNWFKLQNAVTYLPYLELNSFGDNFTIEVDFLYDVPEPQAYGRIYFDFYSSDKVDEVPQASSGPYAPGIKFDMYTDKTGSAHFTAVGVSTDLAYSSPNNTDIKAFKDGELNHLSF